MIYYCVKQTRFNPSILLIMYVKIAIFVLQFLLVHSQEILQPSITPKLVIDPNPGFLDAIASRSLVLLCSGNPDDGLFTDFKWLDPRREVISEGVIEAIKVGQNSLRLTFLNPSVEDSGNYKCIAKYNNTEYLEEEVQILFKEDISFENCSDTQVLYFGEDGEIACNPVSNQELEYVWWKDDKKLAPGRFVSSPSGLIIRDVRDEDAGTYSLEAFESKTGSTKRRLIQIQVVYKDATNTTGIDSVTVLEVTDNAVTFDIRFSTGVQSIEVNYVEDYERISDVAQWAAGDKYTIGNLIPSGRYHFQFRSKPSSSTEYTNRMLVELLPRTPDVAFRLINDGQLVIEWTKKVDDDRRNSIDKYRLSYDCVEFKNDAWKKDNCVISIDIPSSCRIPKHKVTGLTRGTYEISLAAHTSAGFGKPYTQKVEIK